MESLNLLDYNADPSGQQDSADAIQQAIDDASRIGRGIASGEADSNVITLESGSLDAADAGKYITIGANLGLQPNQYYLLIDEVLSPDSCTIKSWNNQPVSIVNGFESKRIIWQRGGLAGKKIAAPQGKYLCSKSIEILGPHVGLIGEGGDPYTDDGTRFQFTHFGVGFIEQPFIGKDTYWKRRGEPIISGAGSSYRLPDPNVFWDYADLPHVQLGLKDSQAFTIEFYIRPHDVSASGHQILAYGGALPGGGFEGAFTCEIDTNGKWTWRTNLSGTVYISSFPTLPTAENVYHVALQFNGSELGVFINGVYQQSHSGLAGKKLVTKPYQLFALGGYRIGWPSGGQQVDAVDCDISHLRVSRTARYPTTGFTPALDVPSIDGYTLLLDEGDQDEGLFVMSLAGFNYLAATVTRTETIKYGGGGWAFHTGHELRDFSVYSYGCPLWQHQVIGNTYSGLAFHTWNVGIYGAGDTFNNRYRDLAVAGGRGGIISAGPAGICKYDDVVVTGAQIGAWLASGSGILSNWYVHGNGVYQVVFDLWEGKMDGGFFSNEDVNDEGFQGNIVIGRESDVSITAMKCETYARPVPSVTIIAPRSATIINGMFESHADATEVVKFVGSPWSKVMLINPNHGRWEGAHPQTDVPWSTSAPEGKLVVTP